MRGHVIKRGKNSWSIVLSMGKDPSTGKYKQQWVSVKGTKKDADRRLAEMLHQIDTGGFVKPGKVTVAEFLERWLKDYVGPNLGPRTAEGYEHIVSRHLIPDLGSIPLLQIKPEHLQRYYSEKLSGGRLDGKGGLSPKTVRHHHVTLHDALQSAVKWGLRWSDVDLILGQLSVTRSLHHLRNGEIVFRAPKTAKGKRMIALPPSASSVLRDHLEQQKTVRLLLGEPLQDNDLVFSRPDGRPLLPDTVTKTWIKLARRNGLSGVRLHDARHTHASLLLKQGIHPKIVQERLGHATIATTLDTYSHVAPGLQAAAALAFDRVLSLEDQSGARKAETSDKLH